MLEITILAKAGGAEKSHVLSRRICPELYRLVPAKKFLFPVAGQTSTLELKLLQYKNGEETEVPIKKVSIDFTDDEDWETGNPVMVVKDSAGRRRYYDAVIPGSQLPLKVTSYTYDTYIRIYALDENNKEIAYIFLKWADYFDQCSFSLAKTSLPYTGKELTPKVVVKYRNKTIPSDLFYISYRNNKKVGTASVLIETEAWVHNAKVLTFKIVPKSPVISKLTYQRTGKGLTLTWGKVGGAHGYYIWRKAGSGSYQKVKTITSGTTVSWTDTAAKTNGTKYSYYVNAYRTVGSKTYTSYRSVIKSYYAVSRTAITSAKNTASRVLTVKWKKNAKASGYRVRVITGSAKKTVTVNSSKTLSKVISGLTKGKTYKVYVQSFMKVGSTKYYSAWSEAKTVKITK